MNECIVALFRVAEIRRASIRACGSGIAALVSAVLASGLGLDLCASAFGQVPQSLSGAPVQVQPYVPEPGVPLITITPGALNPFPVGDGTGSGGDGTESQPMARELAVMEMVEAKPGAGVLAAARLSAQC